MENNQFRLIVVLLAHLDINFSMLQAMLTVGLEEQLEDKLPEIESEYAAEVLESQQVYDDARKRIFGSIQ